jgi:hypothetical protein
MAIAVFFLLSLLAALAVVYPLLPGSQAHPRRLGQAPSKSPRPVELSLTEAGIEDAVRYLRLTRARAGALCPVCGKACESGDRFCVGCGGALPEAGAPLMTCGSCGAALRAGDRFCARCGQSLPVSEAAS